MVRVDIGTCAGQLLAQHAMQMVQIIRINVFSSLTKGVFFIFNYFGGFWIPVDYLWWPSFVSLQCKIAVYFREQDFWIEINEKNVQGKIYTQVLLGRASSANIDKIYREANTFLNLKHKNSTAEHFYLKHFQIRKILYSLLTIVY